MPLQVRGLAGREWTGSQLSFVPGPGDFAQCAICTTIRGGPADVGIECDIKCDIKAMSVILNVDQTDVQCCTHEFFFNHTGSVSTSLTPWNPLLCPLPKLPTHCVRYIDSNSGNQPPIASPVRRQTGAMR